MKSTGGLVLLLAIATACGRSDGGGEAAMEGAPDSPAALLPGTESEPERLPDHAREDHNVLVAVLQDALCGPREGESWPAPVRFRRPRGTVSPIVVWKRSSPIERIPFGEFLCTELQEEGWSIVDEVLPSLRERGTIESRLPIKVREWKGKIQLDRERPDYTNLPELNRGYMNPTLPGYSRDGRWALVLADIGPLGWHPSGGAYLLESTDVGWVVRARKFAHGM